MIEHINWRFSKIISLTELPYVVAPVGRVVSLGCPTLNTNNHYLNTQIINSYTDY